MRSDIKYLSRRSCAAAKTDQRSEVEGRVRRAIVPAGRIRRNTDGHPPEELRNRAFRTSERAPRTAHRALLLCFLLSALAFSAAPAQPGQSEIPTPLSQRTVKPQFEVLGLEDGLSHSNVTQVFQDRNGFMWFGTTDGLNRYDGYEIKTYLPVPFDSTSLSSGYVWGINEDESGALWIGTRHGGLNRMDPVTGEFQRFQPDDSDSTSIGGTIATQVVDDGEKYIWVSSNGLNRTDRLNPGEFTVFHANEDDETSLTTNVIWQIYQALDGTLWVSTMRGLHRLDDPETGRFTRFLTEDTSGRSAHRGLLRLEASQFVGFGGEDKTGLEIYDIVEREEEPGVFWLPTDAGLIRFDTQTGSTATYEPESIDPHGDHGISGVARDPQSPSILWTTVYRSGLYRFDIRSKRFQFYSDEWDGGLFADRSGSIWISASGTGVARFSPQAVGFGAPLEVDDPLYNDDIGVWSIHQDRQGILWAGIEMDSAWALFGVDRVDGTSVRFDVTQDSSTVGPDPIWAIFEDTHGRMWLGSSVGLCLFDRSTGGCSYFHPDPENPTALNHGIVRDLMEDAAGNLWVATTTALHRMSQDEAGVFARFLTEFGPNTDSAAVGHVAGDVRIPGSWVRNVMEDQAGFIWASSSGGLAKIDPNSDRIVKVYQHEPDDPTSLSYPQIMMTHERPREPGVFWVGTFGGGLNRLDDRTGIARHFTTLDGLPSNVVYGILEDRDGRLWLSTNRGLSRFDPDTETFRNYGTESGLRSLSFQTYAHYQSDIGEMFFGGKSGIHTFFPNEVQESQSVPQVALVDIKVANESIKSSGAVSLDASLDDTDEIRLGHHQRDLSFDFVAFHYADPGRNEYAYMLEGFDEDWVESGNRRNATFTNLEPGEYTFRVKAANSDGIWNEEGASIRVVIAPPWWRTWWAYGMYGVFFIGGIFAVDRIQRRRLLAREREKTREVELEHAKEIETAYNELRTTQDRLIQSEKMASLGQLTAGIAHEIKNPLNFVNNFSDLSVELLEELNDELLSKKADLPADYVEEAESILEILRANAKKIHEHGRRADSIVHGMLQHSSGGKGEREDVDLNALLDEHVKLAYHGMRARETDFNTSIEMDLDDTVGLVNVVPQDLGRVFLNLVSNALDAMIEFGSRKSAGTDSNSIPEGWAPKLTVTTKRNAQDVEVTISDNGSGIPDDVKSKIFEPFFTTKPTGSGTGLGLSMSYDIITKGHGGTLEVESAEGEGATFIVRLPA